MPVLRQRHVVAIPTIIEGRLTSTQADQLNRIARIRVGRSPAAGAIYNGLAPAYTAVHLVARQRTAPDGHLIDIPPERPALPRRPKPRRRRHRIRIIANLRHPRKRLHRMIQDVGRPLLPVIVEQIHRRQIRLHHQRHKRPLVARRRQPRVPSIRPAEVAPVIPKARRVAVSTIPPSWSPAADTPARPRSAAPPAGRSTPQSSPRWCSNSTAAPPPSSGHSRAAHRIDIARLAFSNPGRSGGVGPLYPYSALTSYTAVCPPTQSYAYPLPKLSLNRQYATGAVLTTAVSYVPNRLLTLSVATWLVDHPAELVTTNR